MQKSIEKIETNPKTGATLVRMKVAEGDKTHDISIPFSSRKEAVAGIRTLTSDGEPSFSDTFKMAATQRIIMGARNADDILTEHSAKSSDQQGGLISALMDFVKSPKNAWDGKYAPPQADPNVLTEEDAFRQNHARDKEVLDGAQMGWFSPAARGAAGAGVFARTMADYFPSRMTKGAEEDTHDK